MGYRLPSELEALKKTISRIVRNECIPLEPRFLSTPPGIYSGGGKGAPGGLAEDRRRHEDLPLEDWGRPERFSREMGIFTWET